MVLIKKTYLLHDFNKETLALRCFNNDVDVGSPVGKCCLLVQQAGTEQ